MSTELATNPAEGAIQKQTHIDNYTLEAVINNGDLSKLEPAERVLWYRARCDAAGLDYRTQPFEYIVLKGKLKLYATKTASDQLINNRKITLKILNKSYEQENGIYEVHCSAEFPDGRQGEDIGSLHIGGLKGQDLADARMKCVTKAKRRTVISACGLGMLDETEVDSIRDARRVRVVDGEIVEVKSISKFADNSGDGRSGSYAKPALVKQCKIKIKDINAEESEKWVSRWIACNHGTFPHRLSESPINNPVVASIVLMGAIRQGKLEPVEMALDAETGEEFPQASIEQIIGMIAIVADREPLWFEATVRGAFSQELSRLANQFAADNPSFSMPPEYEACQESDAENESQEPETPKPAPAPKRMTKLELANRTRDDLAAKAKANEQVSDDAFEEGRQ